MSKILFHLIKSLSSSEKRNFKSFAERQKRSTDKHYLLLFEHISKQENYNEEIVKQKFKGNNLPRAKNYLKEIILHSLQETNRNYCVAEKIHTHMNRAKVLLQRECSEEALKVLKIAKKKAIEYEFFEQVLAIIKIEKDIYETTNDYFSEKLVDKLYREQQEYLEKMQNLSGYWRLFKLIHGHHKKSRVLRSNIDKAKLQQIMAHKLLQNASSALSFTAKTYFYHTQSTYNLMNSNVELAYKNNKAHYELFEKNKEKAKLYPKKHWSTLYNYLTDCMLLEKYEELDIGIKKLKTIAQKDIYKKMPDVEATLFRQINILSINAYTNQNKFNEALALIPDIKKGLKKYAAIISKVHTMDLKYMMVYTYFACGKYPDALDVLEDLLSDNEKEVQKPLLGFARIFKLILLYELEQHNYFESQIGTAKRWLKYRHIFYEMEKVFFKEMEIIFTATSKREKKEKFTKLKETIIELQKNDEKERAVNNYFDFITWIDTHLTGKSYVELRKKKAEKQGKH